LQGSERKQQMAKEYREKVEKELRDICNDVLVSHLSRHSNGSALLSLLIRIRAFSHFFGRVFFIAIFYPWVGFWADAI
jgi:hypothetical protein